MKKVLIGILLCFTAGAYAQTYKLEKIFKDSPSETSLSHWRILEDTQEEPNGLFSLWGYHRYDESWTIAYEVEYYKADAQEMYTFLSAVSDFAQKYKNEGEIITYISGVKVKYIKNGPFNYCCVFEKEGKVCCSFSAAQWKKITEKFASYCEKNEIGYE